MQSRVKLTKRQIKEDKFTAFMLTTRSRIMENWQFYVIGVIAVVLAVVAISYYMQSQGGMDEAAEARLTQAMGEYQQGQSHIAILSLQGLISDYGSTSAARQATYMIGLINYEIKNYPEAIRYWEQYLSRYTSDQMQRAAAHSGIGASYENQGDYVSAAAAYQRAFDEYPENPIAGEYLLDAVRVYLLGGDTQQAQQYLDRLETEFPNSTYLQKATALFEELGTQS